MKGIQIMLSKSELALIRHIVGRYVMIDVDRVPKKLEKALMTLDKKLQEAI